MSGAHDTPGLGAGTPVLASRGAAAAQDAITEPEKLRPSQVVAGIWALQLVSLQGL